MYGRGIENAFWGLMIIGFLVGGFVFWLIPKLWHLLKPLIHAATG